MAASNLNLLSGFRDGARDTLAFIDRIDEERDEERLERQQAEDRKLRLADLATARERQALLFDQGQEDRTLRLADDETQRGRLAAQDERTAEAHALQMGQAEHLKTLRPLERRRAELYNSGLVQEQTIRQAQIDDQTRAKRESEAIGYIREGALLAEAGDHNGALRTWEKLSDYGLDFDGLSATDQSRVSDTMEGLLSGEVDIESEDAGWLAEQVLLPSLATSARDPDKWEIHALVPNPGRDTFSIELRDKESGEIKDATMLNSSDPGDPVTEFTMEDMIGAGEALASLEKTMMATRVAALGARLGQTAGAGESNLDRARARKLDAEAAKLESEVGEPGESGYSAAQKETFVANYAEDGLEVAAAAITQDPAFNPTGAMQLMRDVQAVMSEPPRKGEPPLTQLDAIAEATRRAEARAAAMADAATFLTENEGLLIDEDEVAEIYSKMKANPMSRAVYTRQLAALKAAAERRKRRDDRRAEGLPPSDADLRPSERAAVAAPAP